MNEIIDSKKMNINKAILIFLSLSIYQHSYCQSSKASITQYQPLQVGDKVPNYTLHNLINYSSRTAKISDFKEKLLILDFWSTNCSSCIKSWPKLLELQKEFDTKIQIILVNTYQDESIVRSTIEKIKRVKGFSMSLPMVCGDTVLGGQLFKHQGVPHVVWINDNGYIKAITGGDVVNSNNIKAILNGDDLNLAQKIDNDDYIRFDRSKPLFINGNGGRLDLEKRLLQSSVLIKKPENLDYTIEFSAGYEESNGHYIIVSGYAIKDLYAMAFSDESDHLGHHRKLQEGRIFLDIRDSSRYISLVNDELVRQNLFTYQLISLPTTRENMQKKMQSDLKRNFGLEVKWETCKKKCLVLSVKDTTKISYKEGGYTFYYSEQQIKFNNVSIPQIMNVLLTATDYYFSPYPIIDETGFKGKIGRIEFEADVSDYKALDKELKKYGIRFTLQDREINVLVIKEPEGYQLPFMLR